MVSNYNVTKTILRVQSTKKLLNYGNRVYCNKKTEWKVLQRRLLCVLTDIPTVFLFHIHVRLGEE